MVKKILSVVVLFVVALLGYVAMKPADYFIKRELVINARSEVIFPYIVSMKKADEWMPWKESDPKVQNVYSGPDVGVGATSSWESSGSMGTGKAEVVEVIPNQKVKTKITYTKPMVFTQDSEFILTPNGDTTTMAWTVSGQSPFIARLMCTLSFRNMDDFVGGEFEKGLNKLKAMVESGK